MDISWSDCCEVIGVQRACQPSASASPLVPSWHLRLLLCVLVLAPTAALLSGATLAPAVGSGSQIGELYAPLLLTNLGFAAYVCRVGLGASRLRELFGRYASIDVLLGILFALALLAIDGAIVDLIGSPESLAAHTLMPRTVLAQLCWLPVALSTALSEELVYRGYLRRQLAVQCGSAALGNVVQAALFGVAHGAQGPSALLRYGLYGWMFGTLAARRRGLLAVVVCHGALDLYAGLMA